MDSVESPKIKKSLPKYLNLQESELLLSVIEGVFKARDYCIISLFLNCALRLSELISLDTNVFTNNPIIILGKGNKERPMYFNNVAIASLKEYAKFRSNLKCIDKNALFLSKDGKRISKRRVQGIVKENLKKAGLNKFSVHKLRHTAATLMFQHGNVDIRTLQTILGHESLSSTQIYTHVSNMQLKKAMESNPLVALCKINKKS
jgi:site-specific recombinase XerD